MGARVTTGPIPSVAAAATSASTDQDPAPIPVAPSPARAHRHHDLIDRFLGSDPGLNRLRIALMSVLTIGLILEAEWLLVHFTGALQIRATPGAALPPAQA